MTYQKEEEEEEEKEQKEERQEEHEEEEEEEVFDLVYCINLPEDPSFFRIDYAQIEALFAATIAHTTPARVRVHLLSNDDTAITLLTHLYPPLLVHDYRLTAPSPRAQAFLASYVHQSTNPPEMERLCMWRWILMADYFSVGRKVFHPPTYPCCIKAHLHCLLSLYPPAHPPTYPRTIATRGSPSLSLSLMTLEKKSTTHLPM